MRSEVHPDNGHISKKNKHKILAHAVCLPLINPAIEFEFNGICMFTKLNLCRIQHGGQGSGFDGVF